MAIKKIGEISGQDGIDTECGKKQRLSNLGKGEEVAGRRNGDGREKS